MSSEDARLYRAVNRFADHTSWAHGPFVAYATFGITIFAALLLVGWWGARARHDLDTMARLLWAGLGTLLAVGLNQPLGSLVGRARPYAAMPTMHVLIARSSDFTFPSDHSVAAGAVAAGLCLAVRRLGWVAAGLALLMAVARVYVGAHYPADVVAGLLLGAAVVAAGAPLAVPALRAVVGMVDRSPLRPVIAAGAEPAPALAD